MAIGDILNGISADNAIITHQPASGVEEFVTSVHTSNTDIAIDMIEVSGDLASQRPLSTSALRQNLSNMKIGITNTIWFQIRALGAGVFSGFSAIQVK